MRESSKPIRLSWRSKGVLWAAVILSTLSAPAWAQTECQSVAGRVKTLALQDYQPTFSTFNFPADGQGHFDSLMSTTVNVGGSRLSCLVVHFNAMGYPLDNAVVFQVRVDGVPMEGHLGNLAGVPTPAVMDPEETDQNLPRMISHSFFKKVPPGPHKVEVLFAGCCSGAPPVGVSAYAGSPVLIVQYR